MINSLFGLLKKRQKKDSTLFCAKICFFAKEAIKELKDIDPKKVKIISFKNNRLKISTEDPITAHRLKMNEEKFIKKIQKRDKINSPIDIIYIPKTD